MSSQSSTGSTSYQEFMRTPSSEPFSPGDSSSVSSMQSPMGSSRSVHTQRDSTGDGGARAASTKPLHRKMTPQQIRGALLRSSPTLTGYIKKRGGISFGLDKLKSWKDRYFVLHGGTLAYYKSEEAAVSAGGAQGDHEFNQCKVAFSDKFPGYSSPLPAPKAYLPLEGARIYRVKIDHPKLSSEGILLTTARQSEVLAFNSSDERESWYSAVEGVMQAMHNYNPKGCPLPPQPPEPRVLPSYLSYDGDSLQSIPVKRTAVDSSPSSASLADSYYEDTSGSLDRRSIDSSHTGPESVANTTMETEEQNEF